MTRREFSFSAVAAAATAGAPSSPWTMSVESYIFTQYAERQKKTLAEIVPQMLSDVRKAGFRNIELNPQFLAPDLRDRVLQGLREYGLMMPSVYVGGPLHTQAGSEKTITQALEIAEVCRPFGCVGLVNNPDPKANKARKTDTELAFEAQALNRMGQALRERGVELRVHHHTPQLEENAREWRYILQDTLPNLVSLCVDVDWAYQGGFDPVPFLREAGPRVKELHIRSERNKLWLEQVQDSEIDYRAVAQYLKEENLQPLLVVELAWMPNTVITRSLEEDLRLSRLYTESVFAPAPSHARLP
jgi:inosose dehydratase